MKPWISILLCLVFMPVWGQVQNCQVQQQVPLKLMEAELARNFKVLKKQKPPIYYLSYRYNEVQVVNVTASLNGISSFQDRYNTLAVMARVGSAKLDNTRALKGEQANYNVSFSSNFALPNQDAPRAFVLELWQTTERAVKQAQQEYSQVLAHTRTMTEAADQSADFVFPPQESFCQVTPAQEINIEQVKELLQAADKLPQGKPYVLSYNISFGYEHKQNYFTDSRGTRLTFPSQQMRLMYTLKNRTQDGMEISRFKDYNVSSLEELPSKEQLSADISQSLQELEMLSRAEQGEPFTAPTILKGKASAVFVHEVLGHRLESHRQKDEDQGQTFTGKVGQQIISPLLTIVDDPTLTSFNGSTLRGHYLYDDEGVKARPVTLVENGILKNFLMSSSPIKGFAASNGHGRLGGSHRAVARMGIVRATSSQTVSYEELEKMLLAEIKRQGKPYGFIIEDLGGGYTLTDKFLPQSFKLETKLVWRIYPDGHKEAVRGLDIVGTPLVSFNKVLAVGNDDAVFDGSCGAESGWVPQTNIAPSLLLESLETERTQTSPMKPPLLPSPLLEKGGKK